MRMKKYDPAFLKEKSEAWEKPCIEAVSEDKRDLYQRRIQAVDMYADGYTVEEISKATGISHGHIHELIKKCLKDDGSGRSFGYCALVPGKRLSGYTRKMATSGPGCFNALLTKYLELTDFIKGNLEGNPHYTLEKDISVSTLFKKFISKCHDLGITQEEYPFSVKSLGRRSFTRYVNSLMDTDMKAVSNHIGKDEKKILSSTGRGEKMSSIPSNPYACVQVDGHIIDVEYCVPVEMDDGSIEYLGCQRCWLFPVIDTATRCIIGYSMSQEFTYNQTDVLRAIKDGLLGHEKPDTHSLNLPYPESGGFPGDTFPDILYPVFDMVMLDNAKSHLSLNVMEKLCDTLGCTLCYGAVAAPETRGIIERFFGTIEKTSLHRIPSTTGSSITDVKRNRPDKAAGRYMITYDDLCEVMEAVIAEYNNTPNSSIMNVSPLAEMERKYRNGFLPFTAGEDLSREIKSLMHFTKKVKVRGSIAKGRRPYITFMKARYRNDILSENFRFSGSELTIVIDPDDVSKVTGYLPDGTCIGVLTAIGEFGKVSHSLKMRERINKMASANEAKNVFPVSPVSQFENELKKRSYKSRKARTQADILHREKDKGEKDKAEDKRKTENRTKADSSVNIRKIPTDITHDDIKNLSEKELWNRIRKGGLA